MRRIALRLLCWWGFLACVLAGVITFGVRPDPPPMNGFAKAAVDAQRSQPMAPVHRFTARDGVALAYRAYPVPAVTPAPVVAVLIHGSGGSSRDMNLLGLALARSGVPVFAPDIRGQGLSGRRGDIDYIGQQEDDLADLTDVIRRAYPLSRLVLIGHSSGGGFALRVAGEPVGERFAQFLLLAPALGHNAVTTRPAAGGWVAVYTPRIIGLSILNRLGVHAFDGLPVLAFALAEGGPRFTVTRFWSYRMMQNFGPHGETSHRSDAYRRDAAGAPGPVEVLAGSRDEIFYADRYAEAFAGVTPTVRTQIIPDIDHLGMLSQPAALAAIVKIVSRRDRG